MVIAMLHDTIVARATAPGKSAIHVIRVSGDDAIRITDGVFHGDALSSCAERAVFYGHIIDGERIIDEVMVTVFPAPRSFTRENVVEISCHGGAFVSSEIIRLLQKNGARQALPGEFTHRAYLNGRIDLTEAEAIMDVIDAKTKTQLRLANESLSGSIREAIQKLKDRILDLIGVIDVNIDYPEYDDVAELTEETLKPAIRSLLKDIRGILKSSETGKVIRDGINTAIIGKPNVGKSTLLNALLDKDKAIVTDISGTTRDVIEAELNLDGILLNLMDTAGIRDARDEVERIGIKRATDAIEKADLVLLVLDQSDELTDNDRRLLALTADKTRILVGNKTDLGTNITLADEHIINISAKEKAGLHDLAAEVRRLFIDEDIIESGDPILANTRHIAMIERTQTALEDALKSCEEGFPVDMTEIDLRNAWQDLSDILGETTDDALLDSIFSRFCLGK